jgi:low affinity Fe/Cu permease
MVFHVYLCTYSSIALHLSKVTRPQISQSCLVFALAICITSHINILFIQALKYRSVTDIVRPIHQIVRRREETTGHSVRPQ